MTEPECKTLFDFKTAAVVSSWRAVNDGVMGGRSSGGPRFVDESLQFAGVINTNGGGFSSIRAPLELGALSETNAFRLTLAPDGRDYRLTLRTDVRYRGTAVAYRAPLKIMKRDKRWQTSVVKFSDLKPAIFGRSIEAPEFDAANAQQIGIIIGDGIDGEFDLRVRRIQACQLADH